MSQIQTIDYGEEELRVRLESFFISIYPVEKMISHGLDHHRRVWNYAKELLHYKNMGIYDQFFVKKLMISCYMHDIGMAIDPGVKHGIQSRSLCLQFLKENKLNESEFSDLLEAIEYHDNKEYSHSTGNYDLLTFLSVADDLDAFGYIGIYRYLEIYILRGIASEIIGNLIIENAGKRFENFLKLFGENIELVREHRDRYNILIDFFLNYNREVIPNPDNYPEPV